MQLFPPRVAAAVAPAFALSLAAAQERPRESTIHDLAVPAVATSATNPSPDLFTLDWPRTDEAPDRVILRRRPLRAPGFAVVLVGTDGIERVTAAPAVTTYRGTSAAGARVTAGVTAAGVRGARFAADGSVTFVEPVPTTPTRTDHRLVAAQGLPTRACGVVDPDRESRGSTIGHAPDATGAAPIRVAEVAFDVDHDYFVYAGRSTAACVAAVEQALDAVNVIYERDVGITHRISTIVIRTSEPDPYSGNDAGALLNQLRDHWNTQQQAVRRDVAHLITSRAMGNVLGLAWVGGVCGGNGYALSRFGATFSQNVTILGHELGHNWSAPHCLDPSCVLMCGGCHQFGPITAARIRSYRDGLPCLGTLYPQLAAHWRLDEASGAIARDASSNGHDGTFTNGAAPGAGGARPPLGLAVRLDGVDDAVLLPNRGSLDALHRLLSVSAWIRPDRLTGTQRLVSRDRSWSLGLLGDRLAFTAEGQPDVVSSARLAAGTWTHVAAVVDGTSAVTFYVDGSAVDTVPGTAPASAPATGFWFLGSQRSGVAAFAGRLDDVQLYAGCLSDAHVARLFTSPGSRFCAPTWTAYGSGTAGTTGIPTIGIDGEPAVGSTFRLEVANSSGTPAALGALIYGAQPATVPFLGGTLLVDATAAVVQGVIVVAPVGAFTVAVPADPGLSCSEVFVQALQLDRGAPSGSDVSFTRGVRVTVGG